MQNLLILKHSRSDLPVDEEAPVSERHPAMRATSRGLTHSDEEASFEAPANFHQVTTYMCTAPGIGSPGLQTRGSKLQNLNSNSRELELSNFAGLVLGCIEAKLCKSILVGKLSPRSTQCTPLHRSRGIRRGEKNIRK